MDLRTANGRDVRLAARSGSLKGQTSGLAMGFVQANLVVLPQDWAYDFLLFCQRNPKPCPLLDVTEAGDPHPKDIAADADIRTDVPQYRVFRNGECINEPANLHEYWRNDLVAFLIGCSFTFENALLGAGVPVRHIETNRNVPMYRTNRPCRPAGRFHGPLVVSMRPMNVPQAIRATAICSRFSRVHGTPVHVGNPSALGIADIHKPDYGDPAEIRAGEVPVFWACGVTPQAVAVESKPPLLITHKPGHMFLTDWKDGELDG
jgi:uncharacterized protein YcsI (UPF0317 family)